MADNDVLTNGKTEFDADTNPAIPVRSTEKSTKKVQHVIIDWGGTGAESTTVPTFTVTGTVTATPYAGTPLEGEKNVTLAITPEALGASTAIKEVEIVAKVANTGTIWVKSTSTQNQKGRPLVALQSCVVKASNLASIFLEATVNGEGVTFIALT